MRTCIIALVGCALALGSNLHRIRRNDQCGFADSSGTAVIGPQYADCGDFSDGLAPVRVDDKWGYIDEKGEVSIAPRFKAADGFSEGLAFVTLEGDSKAVIDKTGKVLFGHDYYQHGRFHEGLARVRVVAHWRCLQAGNVRDMADAPTDCPAENLQAMGGLWGYIDKHGAMALPPGFWGAEDFSDGLARVAEGYIDHQGTLAIKASFSRATNFAEGVAAVQQDFNKWGYIDKHGGWVAEPTFEKAEPLCDGRGLVKLDGKFGFVDAKGNAAVPIQYDDALPFSEGLAAVRQGTKWGYIDRWGKLLIASRFDAAQSFADSRAVVSTESQILTINKTGEQVSAKPPTITQTFQRLQTFEGQPFIFSEAADPTFTLYKEQLRELVLKTLQDLSDPAPGTNEIRAELGRRLKEAGIRFSGGDPEKDPRPYGVIDKVEVVRPAQHPELLSVIFDFNLAGNIDSAFSLFGQRQSGWELLLRDEHIPTPNPEMLWADTWHVAAPEFTAREKDGSFVMLLCSDSDRSTDGGYGVEVELRRFDVSFRSHRIFRRQFTGKNHQIALDPDGLRLEVAEFTHDTARGGTRAYPYRYRVRGDEVTRIVPVAFSAHDFVEEWGNAQWEQAAAWSDPPNRGSLQQWHERIRNENGYFGGEMSVQVCDTKRTLWQIEVTEGEDHSIYFIVNQTGKWDFVMKAVSDKPLDGCTDYEPENTDWRRQPTMFKEPTTE